MKIHYTLPGLDPGLELGDPVIGGAEPLESPFRSLVPALNRQDSVTWQELLELHRPPPDPSFLAPPPQSRSPLRDAAEKRRFLRSILSRRNDRSAVTQSPARGR